MVGAFSDYLPLDDLLKIVAVCLVVAVVAPAAVSISIAGLDRRAHAEARGANAPAAVALIVLGAAILAALVGIGLYVLFER